MSRVSTFVLDCDGVLWRGSEVTPRAREALQALRKDGRRLIFLTNNSSKSRQQYVSKFGSLGIEVEAEEIVASSYAAAAYLRSIGFDKKVFAIASAGVFQELEAAGIPYTTSWPGRVEAWQLDEFSRQLLDPQIGAVVVGFDAQFSYAKLATASIYLREVPGCLYIATNPDAGDRVGPQRIMPGTGCLVAAVSTAADRQPVIVGKGGAWLLPWLLQQYALDAAATCIVGDRLDTDIALGKQAGFLTVLPLTGVTSSADLAAAHADNLPDYVVDNFAVLAGL